jgi:molybdopterin/thiamine biosynthesis adenylyltransferase
MLDLSRVRPVFDADQHRDWSIAIVGLGAIGSRVAHLLTDVGLGSNLTLYDHDTVELANLSSQTYVRADVGRPKALALKDQLMSKWQDSTRGIPRACCVRVGPRDTLNHRAVITCLDSMRERRTVIGNAVFLNGVTDYVMDARITAKTIFAIGFDPRDPAQFGQYMEELYDDPPAEHDAAAGGCRVTPSVAPTASIAASLLATLFMDRLNGDDRTNEVVAQLHDFSMERRRYRRATDAHPVGIGAVGLPGTGMDTTGR